MKIICVAPCGSQLYFDTYHDRDVLVFAEGYDIKEMPKFYKYGDDPHNAYVDIQQHYDLSTLYETHLLEAGKFKVYEGEWPIKPDDQTMLNLAIAQSQPGRQIEIRKHFYKILAVYFYFLNGTVERTPEQQDMLEKARRCELSADYALQVHNDLKAIRTARHWDKEEKA